MDGGDHCSVTHHPNRSEDDDVGNIEADVERSHYMAHSKKSKVEVVGAGHKHTCTSDSVSMVKETGVELGTRNHDAACPAPNVRVQTPSEREVDKGERRESQVVETSIGPHGLIRSLSSGDLNRPAISLEVVLNQTCFSADGRMLPAATAWAKLDGDEVAGNRALIGADLACINEVEQRKESLDNHTAEEGDTIVEETPREGGSSREKVACVAGPSMDGSEQTSNSNDGTFRCAQQDSPSGHSSGYDFNNGFGPDFNFAENLNIESADNLGPSIGPGINLEVCLVHSPNVPEPPPKPIESYNLNPISSGLLALGQSVSPTPKSGPIGNIPRNLTHSAQSKLPILTKKSLHPEKKKGKKKINLEGFNSFARFHGYRTAAAQKPTSKSVIFKPAASVFAQSELSDGSSSSNKHLLEEAKATIQLGKSLGINFNGKEDIVLSKIIDLEIKDKDRISNDGKAQK